MQIVYTFLLVLGLNLPSIVLAQSITIKGKVREETGAPAKGIRVNVQGTKTSTATDSIGAFSIAVPKLPATLIFTGVGYEPSEFRITEENIAKPIEIRLHFKKEALSEVVVVGYGTERKMSTVGAESVAASALGVKIRGISTAKPPVASDKLPIKTLPGSVLTATEPRSKILTAGELSDFKKWKLWGDYSESEFKTWSAHWDMVFKKRYCVQVQNSDHKSVVGERVYLVNNQTKDTLWQAVTDNTGKAELWGIPAKEDKDATMLGQGTIYPDVIESVSVHGPSVTIKSHHNVGGLPKKMHLKLVEPLRYLFKDEVRRVGRELGIPDDLLNRHPFPGPGLAIRILGEVTEEKVKLLQAADDIYVKALKKHNLYATVWQAGAILLPVRSVGVMGDERTYEFTVALRAVTSVDGMTADWAHLPYDFLAQVSNEIINSVRGINRVVYDISSKPPATIEWE